MRKLLFLLLILSPALLFSQVSGDWSGELSVGPNKLPLVFHINKVGNGYNSLMDSPAQGAYGIKTDKTQLINGELSIEIGSLKASFVGTLQGEKILGMFSQGGLKIPLTLEKVLEEVDMSRLQDPKAPYPYKVETFSFKNEKAGITLKGTLSIPKDCPNCPVAILHSGSGPQNRDSEIFNHRPFWVLADELSRNKIAVLRYDDRGVGESEGNFAKSTTDDFTSDFMAAINAVKKSGKIDSNKVGIIGHSEGGLVCIKTANKVENLAFVILLASPALPGAQILLQQQIDAVKQASLTDEQKKDLEELLRAQMDILLKTKKLSDRKKELKSLYKKNFKKLPASTKNMGLEKYTETQIKGLCTPWVDSFIKYDPRMALGTISIPLLALNGELDTQVQAAENTESIDEAMRNAGNKHYQIEILPGLNHLFQKAETGSVMEYGMIEETFNPEALHLISSWINKTIYN